MPNVFFWILRRLRVSALKIYLLWPRNKKSCFLFSLYVSAALTHIFQRANLLISQLESSTNFVSNFSNENNLRQNSYTRFLISHYAKLFQTKKWNIKNQMNSKTSVLVYYKKMENSTMQIEKKLVENIDQNIFQFCSYVYINVILFLSWEGIHRKCANSWHLGTTYNTPVLICLKPGRIGFSNFAKYSLEATFRKLIRCTDHAFPVNADLSSSNS